ncbi:MAG: hypothetical protein ACRDP4_13535 [Nocardioidaceae bacterium]
MEMFVTDPRTIKVLLSEQALTFLEPYLGATRSISQAAERTGRSLQRTHYWTRRLHDVGLIEVRETALRPGLSIRRYQAIADSFRVPAHVLPVGLFDSMMTVLSRALVHSFETAHPEIAYGGDVSIHRARNASGIVIERTTPEVDDDGPADALQCSFTTRLAPEDAAQLRTELAQLRDRWSGKTEPVASGHPVYLSMLALAPLADDT